MIQFFENVITVLWLLLYGTGLLCALGCLVLLVKSIWVTVFKK
ncbi:hypothetical protein [Flavobacterium sp. NRK1]|nr:hypothetical protein [Flavobacterium sp. NRK1]